MKNRIKIIIFIIIINLNFIYIYLNYFSIMKNRIELFTIFQIKFHHYLNIYHVLYFLLIIILIIIYIQMKYYFDKNKYSNKYLICIS